MPFNSQGYLISNSSPLPSHSTPSPGSDAVDHPKSNMYHSHPHMNGKPVQVSFINIRNFFLKPKTIFFLYI